MSLRFQIEYYLITTIAAMFSGFFVYSVLSYLFISTRITIPISITMALLIFGLTKYYNYSHIFSNQTHDGNSTLGDDYDDDIDIRGNKKENIEPVSRIMFITIFAILIIISSLSYKHDFHIFVNWNEIGGIGIIQLGAGIMLCFFIPGYGIVLILTKRYKIEPILMVLLAYLLSMLITGLSAYISALSFDSAISESKFLFEGMYLGVLVSFLIVYPLNRITSPLAISTKYYLSYHFMSKLIFKFWTHLRTRASELVVFGSLFMLIIVSTYLLYGGTTIGDQWYHQGRALLFMSGSFKEAAASQAEAFYPPFQSALLAALTTLSGIPLVNSYASIAFLNAVPMFSFYLFFSTWVPATMRKAALLAASLFTLSSGFGWIYLLTNTPQSIISQQSSLEALRTMGHLDIVSASNFVIPTAPDFSTGLIYITLPAGFVLLSMVRTGIHNKFINIFTVSAISVLGIISHYEFYIFVIIASIIPFIFKIKARNFVYVGLLIAISIVYMMDITTPGNFFTSVEILGFPLLFLIGLFVIITWAIYSTAGYLRRILEPRLIVLKALRKLRYHNKKFNFMTGTIIIFLVAYAYLLCFIVLSQLSLDTVRDHTYQSNVPWYLYPMRLGVAGLFGLAFVLSYLFKRFEKQVFVFGIMIVIAVIIGPYYSEGRLGKYVMVGMVALASLMIYKILIWRSDVNPVRNIALLGIIIIASGLSILIFTGYSSLILQTQDHNNTLARRHFPSMTELHLFEVLHDMVNVNSKKYNVISFLNEYDSWKDGIMSKISSFAGLPFDKLRQSPLTLNASTLDAFYRHLDYSDARYVILPKHSIQYGKSMAEPTRFAIDHFKHIYDDKDNIILEVPPIESPTTSPNAKVGMVYNRGDDLLSPSDSNTRLLQFNNNTFNLKLNDESVAIQKENQSQGIILFGSKKGNSTTLWSKIINSEPRVNYIEARFRITSEDENKSNDIRLKWREGDKEYFIKHSKNGLELFQKFINDPKIKFVWQNAEIKRNDWIWYTLKIESLDNSINIYVNDVLKIQASKALTGKNNEGISRIGFTTNHNDVEFRPIKIASVNQSSQQIHDKSKYYGYYYPLSLLALSKTDYDIFRESDLSVFSKKVILIPDNIKFDNSTFNRYLDHVYAGATLIVINSDNNFNGTFSRLFAPQLNESKVQSYTSIKGNKNQNLIAVSGQVNGFEMKSSPDMNVIAWYGNYNNQMVVPFAIEKTSGHGRIVLVNARGYFDSISDFPREYFLSLSNISALLGIESKDVETTPDTSLPLLGFVGNMEMRGKITLNSSSLFLGDDADSNPIQLNTTRINIFNKGNNNPATFDNLLIKSIKLIGNSETTINLTGTLTLPDMGSDYNYMDMLIPNNFDITVELDMQEPSYMEIDIQNHSLIKPIKVNNGSKIVFHNITAQHQNFVPVSLKTPEIAIDGHSSIKNAYFDGYLEQGGALLYGSPFGLEGELKMKFDFIDHYNEPYREGTKTSYITFIQSLSKDGNRDEPEESLKIPGDLPFRERVKGEYIPLEKILWSPINFVTLAGLGAATAAGIWLITRVVRKIS